MQIGSDNMQPSFCNSGGRDLEVKKDKIRMFES